MKLLTSIYKCSNMKTKLFFTIISIIWLHSYCLADTMVSINQKLYKNPEIEASYGLTLSINKFHYFAWLSIDNSLIRFLGQEAADLKVIGFGLGAKHYLSKHLQLFLSCGYYYPDTELRSSSSEAIFLKMHEMYDTRKKYDQYRYELTGRIGGTIGLEYQIKNRFVFGFEYGFLQLKEEIVCTWDHDYTVWHEYLGNKDFSHIKISVGIVF